MILADMVDFANVEAKASTTIYVCITCRCVADGNDQSRSGAALAAVTVQAANGSGIAVQGVRCLANCRRGLSAAIRHSSAWTYVFGDLEAARDANALVEGARLLANAADGRMPWSGRPEPLKRGLIARVPPLGI